ncbi:MAG: hypothetical protein KAH95_13365, partial [Spirochaetales bacterium]|nr:hypothetical protein [Spirochaetales bacterium]
AVNNMPAVKIVTWLLPAMSDIIMVAGIALLVASYGFIKKKTWAMNTAIIAGVLGLLGAWMAIVWPLMIAYPLRYIFIFFTFLIVWSIMLIYVRKTKMIIFALATVAGIAMVLNFMNGVACLNLLMRTIEKTGNPAPLFVVTQQLNWLIAVAWGVFAIGVLYGKSWVLPLGLGGGILSLISGSPLAFINTKESGEFSMFWIAVIVSGLYLILLLITGDKLWSKKAE